MADTLFSDTPDRSRQPLAERLRPRTIDEVIGQQHLLGAGKPLRVAFESGEPHSMILWGPPGVGKTTLARLMASAFDAEFIALSAVLSGVKDIREAVERAEQFRAHGRRTLVFVDEVHRFNKSQQDAFLPHVESGLFTFIGATTENPSFEVNGALLSRAAVYVLKSLDDAELTQLALRASEELGAQAGDLSWQDEALQLIVASADGDGRKLLNNIEIVARAARTAGAAQIDTALLGSALSENLRRFDKGGDAFYDQISALHKSVRGSDPDAALYWFCRMIDGGADPRYLARRIVRMAWEDIGLADPRAARITLDAAETYERLGSPEGELALGQALIYLAVAPKSNAGYNAYNAARAFVGKDKSRAVPVHLRNAPTKLMKELGHGHAYRYAHDEPEAYAAGEHYFPDDLKAQGWYQPVPRGLEGKIAEKLRHLRELDAAWHREQRMANAKDGGKGGE
ncbi:replication-associated recombination protein A [Cupriavidus necator]|uniref:Replication-associated recombination protein A n=1 Tax=Cupriavidus necator TaxID=106590 RepID=A0A367PP37_CUPNE|nr:replication-associated recombination protein A [Cupriavidus necator]QQX86126.1 replication-associated recombination protein A [Cupriavidus necator]RCJ09304.1 replication-associated recombination protein A [Cupriavidus necator]